jgi:carbamoyltransferase
MAKIVLGISAFYHDSAAAILKDGEIIAAAQEERFSRKRHDPRFPKHAINYCLEEAFVEASDIDAVVFYDNPLLTWDRIVQNSMMAGPAGAEQFEKACQSVLGVKLWVNDYVKAAIGGLGKEGRVLFTEHHMSHAASAFYPSPFQKAAIMTLDGVGEWATTTMGRGEGSKIELTKEIDYPHSLGLLYSAMTYFTGFKVNSGEYKLMGLAPYGEPMYAKQILDNLIDVKADGSYRLNTEYFGYIDGLVMTNDKFAALFGGPARKPESSITRREMNLAASVQSVLEEVVLMLCRTARKDTGCENLCLAGGVALNCVANGKILREGIFKDVWIQPAAGDAGGALGAALMVAHHYYGLPRKMNPTGRDSQKGSYLGPRYRPEEVTAFLERKGIKYHRVADAQERANRLAQYLDEGKVIGFMSGRMEFGPRALGSRSILGDPRRPDTQATMNLRIKYRESFRPFAPAVLPEMVSNYFEMDCESPYMLLVAPVRKERQLPMDNEAFRRGDSDDMLRVINQPRSDLPAITHVDYSARIQTVHKDDHADFNRLLAAFNARTGCGVVVNTSFNVRGEPIVCTPQDAYLCFMRTEIDVLVMEDCILLKPEQPKLEEKEDWRKQYELD